MERQKKYKEIANGKYLLRSKDKDILGRQDIYEIYISNSHRNIYTIKSLFTGLTLQVNGNHEVLKYEIFKMIEGGN